MRIVSGARSRSVFGRFVKSRRCFELMQEGFGGVIRDIELRAAGESMACTPLMRQLAARRDVTVAQFAQAVSAIYFSMI